MEVTPTPVDHYAGLPIWLASIVVVLTPLAFAVGRMLRREDLRVAYFLYIKNPYLWLRYLWQRRTLTKTIQEEAKGSMRGPYGVFFAEGYDVVAVRYDSRLAPEAPQLIDVDGGVVGVASGPEYLPVYTLIKAFCLSAPLHPAVEQVSKSDHLGDSAIRWGRLAEIITRGGLGNYKRLLQRDYALAKRDRGFRMADRLWRTLALCLSEEDISVLQSDARILFVLIHWWSRAP